MGHEISKRLELSVSQYENPFCNWLMRCSSEAVDGGARGPDAVLPSTLFALDA
jgi:hypothetical protein